MTCRALSLKSTSPKPPVFEDDAHRKPVPARRDSAPANQYSENFGLDGTGERITPERIEPGPMCFVVERICRMDATCAHPRSSKPVVTDRKLATIVAKD